MCAQRIHRSVVRLLIVLLALAAGVAGPARRAGAQCPSAPGGVAAESLGCGVRISWNVSAGAVVRYNIYRSVDGLFGHAVQISTVSASNTSYFDAPPLNNVDFHYWVGVTGLTQFPYNCANPGPVAGTGGPGVVGRRIYAEPWFAPTTTSSCSGVTISWPTPPSDATNVRVVRANLDGTNAQYIAVLAGNAASYLDSSAAAGVTYLYAYQPEFPCGYSIILSPVAAGVLPMVAVATQPASRVVSTRAAMTIVSGITGATTYQWYRDGVALMDTANVTGTHTSQLSIAHAGIDDAGAYTASGSSICGSAVTDPCVLAVQVRCKPDFNNSGSVTVQDIFDFLSAWFVGCP